MRLLMRVSVAAAAWAAVLGSAPALACPACVAASGSGVRLGYYVSTAVLSLTPLLIMGVGVSYVAFKRSRAAKDRRQNFGPR